MFTTEDNDNDLLAELNGEAPNPEEAKELAAAAAIAAKDPLKVPAAKKKSAVQRKMEEASITSAANANAATPQKG